MIEVLAGDSIGLRRCARLLAEGLVVAVPTDTVYGLACDPRIPGATRRLYSIKVRSPALATAVLVASVNQLSDLAEISDAAKRLATRYWPGPLTVVVARRAAPGSDSGGSDPGGSGAGVSGTAGAGAAGAGHRGPASDGSGLPVERWDLGGEPCTIGVRVPGHTLLRRLLEEAGPLAVTSANPHGRPPATSISELQEQFGEDEGALAAILDGGTCNGVPSTVVDLTGAVLACIRNGAIPFDDLEACIGSLRPAG